MSMANSALHIIINFLCTSTASSNTAPIVQNSRTFMLPPGIISVISVQAPTELDTKHLCQLDAIGDLASGIIPLALDHKIELQYHKLLKTPLFIDASHYACSRVLTQAVESPEDPRPVYIKLILRNTSKVVCNWKGDLCSLPVCP